MRVVRYAMGLFIAVAIAGCEGTVTVDMGTTAAANPAIAQVLVDLEGIELSGSDGTETLQFDEPIRMNLAEFVDGNLFRLFTDEQLPDGRYTGVRLLFEEDEEDDDDVVTVIDGREFALTVAATGPSDVAFTVDEDDSSREAIVLTLDLRQSLSFDDNLDEFTLTPLVRGVRLEDTGQIAGVVRANCPAGSSLVQGGSVYVFSGRDITPDDRDAGGVEPYLTTRVVVDVGNTIPAYTLRYVPEGDYTIALTCDGDEEDAATDDDLRFQEITNVSVRAEETTTQNLGS
jgi:hypothetical protein